MEDTVQLKRGYEWREIKMKDGTTKTVMARSLNEDFFVYEENGAFWLTHKETGAFITSGTTQKILRELVNEPEFFEKPLSSKNIAKAVNRWSDRHKWQL